VTLRLSTSSLQSLERSGIAVPHYDRAALAPRILHIGVGGYHRAHMALYADRRISSVLESKDHLYTLIERDGLSRHALAR
jgi:hypothetical protein